jgi:hypothetical protein
MAGRPTDYDAKKADKICSAIATGSRGLRAICLENDLPDPRTVYRWIENHSEFRQRYARAREFQCQVLADEIIDIADTTMLGCVTTSKPSGIETREGDMTEHRRLQIDARKWTLAKLMPHKYGEKTQVTGPNGGAVQVIVKSSIPRPKR